MSLWYKDQDEFYIHYLADHAAPQSGDVEAVIKGFSVAVK